MNNHLKASLKESVTVTPDAASSNPTPIDPTLKARFIPETAEETTGTSTAEVVAEAAPCATEIAPLTAEEAFPAAVVESTVEPVPTAPPEEAPVIPAPFGNNHSNIGELGNEMLERIRKGRAADLAKLDRLLLDRQISSYLSRQTPVDYPLQEAVFSAETYHQIPDLPKNRRLLHFYTVAFLIAERKHFSVDGADIADVTALTAYMKTLLDTSYADLERFCHRMVNYEGVLDPQLEAWLTVLGKQNEIDEWRRRIAN